MDGMIIANNLRKLRLKNNYTQEQVARFLSISAQSVSRWECGNTLPEVTILPEIARLYKVTVDDLLREDFYAYQNYAKRLLEVYEISGKIQDFMAAQVEFSKLFDSGNYEDDDLRSCGVLYQYLMNYAKTEAMKYFNEVLKKHKEDKVYYSTWQQKISLMAQIGEGNKAIEFHEKELIRNSENPKQWILLISACYWSYDLQKAKNYIKKALLKFPEEANLYIYAGDIYKELKEYDEAFKHWNKALELDSQYLDPFYSMGFCYEELEQYDKAYEIWRKLGFELNKRGLEVSKNESINFAKKCLAKIQKLSL